MSVYILCPLFDWVVCVSGAKLYGCLYILDTNSLSLASFAIIFSHSEGSLLTLLLDYFVVLKLLSLIRSHVF